LYGKLSTTGSADVKRGLNTKPKRVEACYFSDSTCSTDIIICHDLPVNTCSSELAGYQIYIASATEDSQDSGTFEFTYYTTSCDGKKEVSLSSNFCAKEGSKYFGLFPLIGMYTDDQCATTVSNGMATLSACSSSKPYSFRCYKS
jgi:hypothetical protein